MRDALERIANASRNFTIVRYRYVHQTGGAPTTDDDMDAATRDLLDATDAAFAALAARSEPPTDALRAAWGEGYRKGRSEPRAEGLDPDFARSASPIDCPHGNWYRDARDFTWCIDCGRWRDDVMMEAALAETEPKP